MTTAAVSSSTTGSRYLYLLFTLCFASGMFGATVSTLMPSYLPVVLKELKGNVAGAEAEQAGAVINSMFLYGWMFGGFIWGMICDSIGRKNAVVFSTAFYAVFTLLTAAAPSWQWLVLFRFFSGFGVGGVIVTTTILVFEAWPQAKRSVAVGMLTICFPIGVFFSGAVAYLFPSWRSAFFIGAIPLLLSAIAYWTLREPETMKENVRALSQKEKLSELFNEANKRNVLIGTVTFGAMLIGLWGIFSWLPTWIQGLLVDSDGQKERGLSMMSLAGAALIGGSLSGWFTLAAGWKRTMMLCFAVCFLMSFLLFKLTTSFSILVYIEIGLLGFFFGVSQGVLSDFISKIFPVSIRATATGFCFNAGRLFTATVVFFVGWLVNALGGYGNSIFAFSWIFVAGLIATFFVKENNQTQQK